MSMQCIWTHLDLSFKFLFRHTAPQGVLKTLSLSSAAFINELET